MATLDFRGAVASPLAGVLFPAADEHVLSIENQTGSGKELRVVHAAAFVQDQSQVWQAPIVMTKYAGVPSGGNTASKVDVGTGGTSSASVVVRTSRTTDVGAATAIVPAGAASRVFALYPPRVAGPTLNQGVGAVNLLPGCADVLLAAGESVVFTVLGSTGTNPGVANTNRRFAAELVWEEWTPTAGGTTSVSGSDSGIGTDTGTVSATVPGADTSTGTDTGTASVTAAGSDSGTGANAGAVSATTSGADTATGTDTGVAAATGSGGETGTGSDSGSASVTASGSDSAAGTDSGTGTATLAGSDSGVGTDAGTVSDITGGPTLLSDSDSGSGTETESLLDLTPPVVPPVTETGPTGGRYEEGGDESSMQEGGFRALRSSDTARAIDRAKLAELPDEWATPRSADAALAFEHGSMVAEVPAGDAARGVDAAGVVATAAGADRAASREAGAVLVTEDEDEERMVLSEFFGMLTA